MTQESIVVDQFPLTSTQEAMLVGALRRGPEFELHQIVVELEPEVDVIRLRAAWEFAAKRHAVLRSRFKWLDVPAPVHEVVQHVDVAIKVVVADSVEEYLDSDRGLGIDLAKWPGFRLALIELEGRAPVLVFTHHHVMLDGTAQKLLLEDVFAHYDNHGVVGSHDAPQFRDHCIAFAARDRDAERRYFQELLSGAVTTTFPRPRRHIARDSGHAELADCIELTAELRGVGAPLGSVLQAAWAIVLSRYCRTDDVVFGVTRNARHLVEGADRMIGCLINSVPVRVRFDDADSLGDVVERVRQLSVAVRPYEQASLSEIHGWIRHDRSIFDSLIVFDRTTLQEHFRALGGSFDRRSFRLQQQSSFPILIAAYMEGDKLRVFLEFDSSRWSAEFMGGVLRRFCSVVRAIAAAPGQRVADLSLELPDEAGRRRSVVQGDLGRGPDSKLVGERIRNVALNRPQSTAFIDFGGRARRYDELMACVDRFARCLLQMEIPRGECVAVCSTRSFNMLSLQVCAVTYGWTLLTIDPAWPPGRIAAVLESASARVLFVERDFKASDLEMLRAVAGLQVVSFSGAGVGEAETGLSWDPASLDLSPVVAADASEDCAYCIFTSGSSGLPKGVRIPQRALVAHGNAAVHEFGLTSSDRVLQFASPAFDVAYEEVFPTLLAGGAIVERPENVTVDLVQFLSFVERTQITVLNLPSAFFHVLVLFLSENSARLPGSVRLMVIGSDRPTTWSVERFVAMFPDVRLINAYGPSEATITSISCDVSAVLAEQARGPGNIEVGDVPIGRPFGACEVILIDKRLQPTPMGLIGEICIKGPQVALGYISAGDRAKGRFIDCPIDGRTMYRSGDLGRFGEDGLIEFIGRADLQVKIRGVRVEPAEIEQVMRGLEGIRDAAVVPRDVGRGTELVAFVTLHPAADFEQRKVQLALEAHLPACFIPSEIRAIEAFPLGSTGKIDRAELGRLASDLAPGDRRITRPDDDMEVYIHSVFSRLLERDDIDVDDSFFEVGGHSLLAVRLLGEMNRIAKAPIPLAAIFSSPSIRSLARLIRDGSGASLPSVLPLNGLADALIRDQRLGQVSDNDVIPLFCICGVNLYSGLAQAMATHRPVFGAFVSIEEDVAAGRQLWLDVPTLATSYLMAIKQVRPTGPYILGGVSFGGLLAFEMARQLERQGEEVRLLVLLDAILPRAFRAKGVRPWVGRQLRRAVERIAGMHPREFATHVRFQVGDLLGRKVLHANSAEADAVRDRIFRTAAERYDREIAFYDGPTVIFRSRTPIKSEQERVDWDLGWAGVVPHKTPVFGVDGDHLGILVEPGASEIAEILNDRLSKSANRSDWKSAVPGWVATLPSPYCMEFFYNIQSL